MANPIKAVIVFGIFVLAVSLLVPTLITATTSNQTSVLELEENETRELTEKLTTTAQKVNPPGDNATISFEDTTALKTNSTYLNATSSPNGNVTLSGDQINVSLRSVSNDSVATVSISYPPMFGWIDGARSFINESGLLIAMVSVVAIIGVIGMRIL